MGFKDQIDRNALIDLGYQGRISLGLKAQQLSTSLKLDWIGPLAIMSGICYFFEAFVTHAPRWNSDHCPVFISTQSNLILSNFAKRFHFQPMWLEEPNFEERISMLWPKDNNPVHSKSEGLTKELLQWNRENFDYISKKKRILLARIQGIQNALSRGPNLFSES